MQFEEQQFNRNMYDVEPKGISGWLIKKGIAKDMKGANNYLIIVAIISVSITIFLMWPDSQGGYLTPEEILEAGNPADITNI